MNDIEIKTTDKELASELRKLKIDDLKIDQRIRFFDCADPEIMAASNKILTFIIASGSGVALNLFSSWLYDKIKNRNNDSSVKINEIEISGNSNLKVEIHNHIYSSEKEIS